MLAEGGDAVSSHGLQLHLPAHDAYEAWARRQPYTPRPWAELTKDQMDAWMAAALAVIAWVDQEALRALENGL